MVGTPNALVSQAIYGREQPMQRLAAAMEQVQSGRGHTLLLAGEAGIGKSRLTGRVIGDASARGWQVLRAAVYEQDRSYPNAVLVELLRAYLAAAPDEAATSLSPVAADVLRLIPDTRIASSPVAASAESDARRLFSVAAGAISGLSRAAPLLAVVEDLHWADDASLDFLLVLSRRAAECPFLLLLTYRDDEVGPSLSRFLAELDRERLCSEVRLERLTLGQVESMVRDILGRSGAVRADFLHALYTLSGGNPFFVEELLRSALADGRAAGLDGLRLDDVPIPRSVQEAVQSRARSLSPEALRLLQLAAVIGIRFDFDLLGALSGLNDEQVMAQIKELIARQLVMEENEDVFVFRHALTAQAVSAGLLGRERRELHARIVAMLEELRGDDEGSLDQLAYHAYAAADWQRALDYLTRAGLRALRLYAPAVALDDFNRALEASGHLEGKSQAALYLQRASAYDALSDFDRARADYERAIAAAEAAGDRSLSWQASLGLGLLWASRDYAAAFPHYERAVSLARELDDPAALARSLMRLGNWHANTGDFASARSFIEEALAKFREQGDRHAEAEALDVLGMACIMGAEPAESARHYRAAIPLLEESNDRRTLASTLSTLAVTAGTYQTDILLPAMTLAEGRALAERSLEVARGTGVHQDECYALWQLGFVLGPMGEYGEALRCAREALALAEELGHEQWTCAALIVLGAIQLDIYQLEEARDALERAHQLALGMNSTLWIQQSAYFLTDVYVLRHQPERARKMRHNARLENDIDNISRRWQEGSAVSVALAEGDAEEALRLIESLIQRASPDAPDRIVIRLSLLRAWSWLKQGKAADAAALARNVAAEAEAHGHLSLLWRCHAVLAAALLAMDERAAARVEADAALDLVNSLASNLEDPALADSFRQQAQTLLPPTLRRRPRGSAGELTEREAEIAALIARGLSNRAIAEELVLSARTVETHVANAMSKLGFSSRAQLAAWSTEQHR